MSVDGREELYRMLLETAEQCPLDVLGECMEIIATVTAKRLKAETGELPFGWNYSDPSN